MRRKIFDIPNARSSHLTPVPRGGGVVIVFSSLIGYTVFTHFYTHDFFWSYLVGALLIGIISWLDDLYSISFIWRLIVHIAAAGIVIIDLTLSQNLNLSLQQNEYQVYFILFLTFLWIVWITNAFNFMDGIDGIAGLQAVTAGIGWFLAGKILHSETAQFYGGILAFSCLGFLIHNWQPAKIFMGDVGSAFLGYSFGVFPVLIGSGKPGTDKNYENWWVIGITLVWFFFFDTILTFLRRFFRREKFWEAHRRHLYQKLFISGYSHRFVSLLYGLLSLSVLIFLIAGIRYNYSLSYLLILIALESGFLYVISNENEISGTKAD